MSRSYFDVLKVIEENNFEIIQFKMIDSEGKAHTTAIPSKSFTMELIQNGICIDTQRYVCVEEGKGDAIFIPDLDSISVDLFAVAPTMTVSGCIRNVGTHAVYRAPDAPLPHRKGTKGDRITSLIFSIISLYFGVNATFYAFFTAIFSALFMFSDGAEIIFGGMLAIYAFVLAVIAIVFGALGRAKCKKCGRSVAMATAGFVLGIVSCCILLIPILLYALLMIIYVMLVLVIVFFYLLMLFASAGAM